MTPHRPIAAAAIALVGAAASSGPAAAEPTNSLITSMPYALHSTTAGDLVAGARYRSGRSETFLRLSRPGASRAWTLRPGFDAVEYPELELEVDDDGNGAIAWTSPGKILLRTLRRGVPGRVQLVGRRPASAQFVGLRVVSQPGSGRATVAWTAQLRSGKRVVAWRRTSRGRLGSTHLVPQATFVRSMAVDARGTVLAAFADRRLSDEPGLVVGRLAGRSRKGAQVISTARPVVEADVVASGSGAARRFALAWNEDDPTQTDRGYHPGGPVFTAVADSRGAVGAPTPVTGSEHTVELDLAATASGHVALGLYRDLTTWKGAGAGPDSRVSLARVQTDLATPAAASDIGGTSAGGEPTGRISTVVAQDGTVAISWSVIDQPGSARYAILAAGADLVSPAPVQTLPDAGSLLLSTRGTTITATGSTTKALRWPPITELRP